MYIYKDYQTQTILGKRFYDLGSCAYPSITTVLGNSQSEEASQWLDAWKARVGASEAARKSKAATDRGTNVHTMMERFIRGEDPKLEEFPQEHQRMFKSLRLEARKINRFYGQEVVLYSHAFEIAGRCDLVGEWEGEPAIIDYKTSGKPKAESDIQDYWLQATFYALAHNEMFGTDIRKLVILMGVEASLPLVFKSTVTDDRIMELALRTEEFYNRLEKEVTSDCREK